MKLLLDAYALLAFLRQEPASEQVIPLLRSGECSVTSVNLAEVLDQLMRVDGFSRDEVAEIVSPLLTEVVRVESVPEDVAWRAAELRQRYYRRKDAELSLADCVLLASADRTRGIATPDPVVAACARAEEIHLEALPDSRGTRP